MQMLHRTAICLDEIEGAGLVVLVGACSQRMIMVSHVEDSQLGPIFYKAQRNEGNFCTLPMHLSLYLCTCPLNVRNDNLHHDT